MILFSSSSMPKTQTRRLIHIVRAEILRIDSAYLNRIATAVPDELSSQPRTDIPPLKALRQVSRCTTIPGWLEVR